MNSPDSSTNKDQVLTVKIEAEVEVLIIIFEEITITEVIITEETTIIGEIITEAEEEITFKDEETKVSTEAEEIIQIMSFEAL